MKPPACREKREKPWGYEIIFTPAELERTGKVLFVRAGCRLSLQYHEEKEETVMLFQGKALLWYGVSEDTAEPFEMEPMVGYTVTSGAVHRYEAVEDSYLMEVSSPERGRTVRLQDDYQRPDEVR